MEKSPERPVLTIAEVYALAAAMDPRYWAPVLLETVGSLRWGELAALRRQDIGPGHADSSCPAVAYRAGPVVAI